MSRPKLLCSHMESLQVQGLGDFVRGTWQWLGFRAREDVFWRDLASFVACRRNAGLQGERVFGLRA